MFHHNNPVELNIVSLHCELCCIINTCFVCLLLYCCNERKSLSCFIQRGGEYTCCLHTKYQLSSFQTDVRQFYLAVYLLAADRGWVEYCVMVLPKSCNEGVHFLGSVNARVQEISSSSPYILIFLRVDVERLDLILMLQERSQGKSSHE